MSFSIPPRARRLAVAIVGVTMAAPLVAQDAAQTPRFSSGVQIAMVDLFPTSRAGVPVTDLRPEEVTVKLDGKPRPVRFLELTRIAEPPRPVVDPIPASDLPAPYGTNKPPAEGRTILIVIDEESFRPGVERPMRAALHELIGNLPALDRVALATLPHGGLKTDLTTKHENALAAIDDVIGLAPQTQTSTEVACRTRFTLEALSGLLAGLQGGRGPTTVLFFSSGMFGPRRGDTLPTNRLPAGLAPPTSNSCDIRPEDFQNVGTAAAGARARFYIIQPDEALSGGGVTIAVTAGSNGSTNLREGLEFLAGATGAQQMTVAVAGGNPLTRIVRETSSYYVVGFQLEPSDTSGTTHAFDMRVSRDGVAVHALPQFAMSRGAQTRSAVGGGSPKDMLRDPTVFRGLLLRTTAFASRLLDDQTLKVISVAEPVETSVPLTGAAVALFDANGRLTAQWTATDAELARLPLTAVLEAPPGQYRLRVAAVDQTGRGGTADSDVYIELAPAGPLKLSSLVLGLMRNNQFVPKLEFGAEPVAISSLEIYGGVAGARISALIEIAPTLNGPAMIQLPLVIEPTNSPNRFTATGAVPIGSLPAGDYVVRAIVGLEGQPNGRVVRTLRKTAPGISAPRTRQ